jgi:hypothetical protein
MSWIDDLARAHGGETQGRAEAFAKRLAAGPTPPTPAALLTGQVPKRPEDQARHAQSLVQEVGRAAGPQEGDKAGRKPKKR